MGEQRLHKKIFRNPDMPDALKHIKGRRDTAMSIQLGIAWASSIDEGRLA